MASGKIWTGPYGKIRSLQQEINNWKYELRLMAEGIRRPNAKLKTGLEEAIAANRRKIKRIKKTRK
jgi:hypothetical protein